MASALFYEDLGRGRAGRGSLAVESYTAIDTSHLRTVDPRTLEAPPPPRMSTFEYTPVIFKPQRVTAGQPLPSLHEKATTPIPVKRDAEAAQVENPQAKKRRGRPPGSGKKLKPQQQAPIPAAQDTVPEEAETLPAKKRRGRPPGSGRKPKPQDQPFVPVLPRREAEPSEVKAGKVKILMAEKPEDQKVLIDSINTVLAAAESLRSYAHSLEGRKNPITFHIDRTSSVSSSSSPPSPSGILPHSSPATSPEADPGSDHKHSLSSYLSLPRGRPATPTPAVQDDYPSDDEEVSPSALAAASDDLVAFRVRDMSGTHPSAARPIAYGLSSAKALSAFGADSRDARIGAGGAPSHPGPSVRVLDAWSDDLVVFKVRDVASLAQASGLVAAQALADRAVDGRDERGLEVALPEHIALEDSDDDEPRGDSPFWQEDSQAANGGERWERCGLVAGKHPEFKLVGGMRSSGRGEGGRGFY